MIVRPHPNACELLFSCSGSIVPAIIPQIVVAAVVGAVAAFLRHGIGSVSAGLQADANTLFTFTPFTALGVAISLFLGFRNNAAYDRWWEGRRQWGSQLIAVRNFGRVLTALKISDQDRRALLRLSIAHTHALRAQLRATWHMGRDCNCRWVCCCTRCGCSNGGQAETVSTDSLDLTRERDK